MGRATALEFAKAGADVAIGSLVVGERGTVPREQNLFTPDEAELTKVKKEIEGSWRTGPRAFVECLQ